MPSTIEQTDREIAPWSWGLVPAVLVSGAALFLYPWRIVWAGYVILAIALLVAWMLDRARLTSGLLRDLALIAVGMVIVSLISVKANIEWVNFFTVGIVLALAVATPYLLSRFVLKDHAIRFPWRAGRRWSPLQWSYFALILALGWLILPFYFITSGVYLNCPESVTTADEIGRFFVGVNAVGTWDELFFICTVFVLFKRHFPMWQSNLLQMVIFVSFLWELGYTAWGPLLTIPFALLQGFTFTITRSLTYVLIVHLLFDLVVFLTIVHARNPAMFDFFLV